MKYDHGTHAAYVLDRCRCDDCRLANRTYERERAARIEPAYVSAGPARDHVRELTAAGIGLKQIAKASGVSNGTLWKLMYGRDGRPSKRVRRSTYDRLLAVTPAHHADGAKVPAGPTWALIDEMVAAGAPKLVIARHIGQTAGGLQLSHNTITAQNARAVADLHAQWKAGEIELAKRDRHGGKRVAQPVTVRRGPPADVSDLILDLAEIVEERREQAEWRQHAACRGRPSWMWFPSRGDGETGDRALAVCMACMVRDQCRAANLDKREGIYGALTARRRRELHSEGAA